MSLATTNIENIAALVRELGLKPGEGNVFYGKVKGFPVGFKFFTSVNVGTALFHIRSPFNTTEKTGGKIDFGDEINELIAADKVEISLENKIVWVTMVDGVQAVADGSAKRILFDTLEALEKAELKGESDRCHYCLKERAWEPVCFDGKVAQICPSCIEQRSRKDTRLDEASKVLPLPIKCILTLATGALFWAVFWITYDLIFETLHTKTLQIPELVIVFVALGLGTVIGSPIGWSFKRIWKQNQKFARILVSIVTIGAVLLGEVFYVTWVIYHMFRAFDIRAALQILPKIWASSDSNYLFPKIITLVMAVTMAETTLKKAASPKIRV